MLTNMELYGRDTVPKIPETVANFRIKLLKERLKELLSIHYTEQDRSTIHEVSKAIDFWTKLRDGEENL